MKILIACEFSGVVRDAFLKKGHYVVSCDFLPSSKPGPHIIGDVLEIVKDGWDMMIAHPPCTHLAVSGARWFEKKRTEQVKALDFVRKLLDAPINKIAVENPVGIISTRIRKPDQIIHPWMFGEKDAKTTCLWLKNLPKLRSTVYSSFAKYVCRCGNVFEKKVNNGCPACGRKFGLKPLWANQTKSGQNKLPPSKDRWKLRSMTYPKIAEAMAEQWG